MRRPFEMLHETIYALKRIARQMAMLLISESSTSKGRGSKRKKEPRLLLTAMTLLERHAGLQMWSG
ncbi:hypothetical protein [Pseudomonas sp. S37]|uniref:hypothetical protein n=1 Tax=Pseudomonas sp. S37 TaxID=2767449 RepID=UPI0019116BBC|nr:hypothetical protein [Pseudomonas sp. S37]